jgi:hypothetical protein
MMRQVVLVAFVAMAMLAVAKDAPERKTWRGDFAQFLALIEAAEKAEPFELAALRKRLLGKRVQWMGTLKSFWERRPYFQESFVRVNETTELARVRYYLDPTQVARWELFDHFAVVGYSGVISDVRVETAVTKTPFLVVDLRQVKLVEPTAANKDIDSDRK